MESQRLKWSCKQFILFRYLPQGLEGTLPPGVLGTGLTARDWGIQHFVGVITTLEYIQVLLSQCVFWEQNVQDKIHCGVDDLRILYWEGFNFMWFILQLSRFEAFSNLMNRCYLLEKLTSRHQETFWSFGSLDQLLCFFLLDSNLRKCALYC